MSAGRCNFETHFGQLPIGCSCTQGVFAVALPSSAPASDIVCTICSHPLSDHDPHQLEETAGPAPRLSIGLISRREVTVRALWQRLQERRVVQVRGTPASGKTTLAVLLENHVQRSCPSVSVIRFTWPVDAPLPRHAQYPALLHELTGKKQENHAWENHDILLIIDEAQQSYAFPSLWNDLIKNLTPGCAWRTKVALFCSYGSPADRPVGNITPTPVLFDEEQRITLQRTKANPDIGLLFTRAEFDEVVDLVTKSYDIHGQRFIVAPCLQNYLWELTWGHPSAVRSLLGGIATCDEFRNFRKTSTVITLNDAIQHLARDKFVLGCLNANRAYGFTRGLPSVEFLQDNPQVTSFLRQVLVNGPATGDVTSNDILRICYQNGWLQAELSGKVNPMGIKTETIYGFTTPLHRRYMENLLSFDTHPSQPTNFQQ